MRIDPRPLASLSAADLARGFPTSAPQQQHPGRSTVNAGAASGSAAAACPLPPLPRSVLLLASSAGGGGGDGYGSSGASPRVLDSNQVLYVVIPVDLLLLAESDMHLANWMVAARTRGGDSSGEGPAAGAADEGFVGGCGAGRGGGGGGDEWARSSEQIDAQFTAVLRRLVRSDFVRAHYGLSLDSRVRAIQLHAATLRLAEEGAHGGNTAIVAGTATTTSAAAGTVAYGRQRATASSAAELSSEAAAPSCAMDVLQRQQHLQQRGAATAFYDAPLCAAVRFTSWFEPPRASGRALSAAVARAAAAAAAAAASASASAAAAAAATAAGAGNGDGAFPGLPSSSIAPQPASSSISSSLPPHQHHHHHHPQSSLSAPLGVSSFSALVSRLRATREATASGQHPHHHHPPQQRQHQQQRQQQWGYGPSLPSMPPRPAARPPPAAEPLQQAAPRDRRHDARVWTSFTGVVLRVSSVRTVMARVVVPSAPSPPASSTCSSALGSGVSSSRNSSAGGGARANSSSDADDASRGQSSSLPAEAVHTCAVKAYLSVFFHFFS